MPCIRISDCTCYDSNDINRQEISPHPPNIWKSVYEFVYCFLICHLKKNMLKFNFLHNVT